MKQLKEEEVKELPQTPDSEPDRSISTTANNMGDGAVKVQVYRSLPWGRLLPVYKPLPAFSPTGHKSFVQLNPDMKTVKQLKEKTVKQLPWIQGQTEDNVSLSFDGKTLKDSTPLLDCTFLPSSVFQLTLKVRGGGNSWA